MKDTRTDVIVVRLTAAERKLAGRVAKKLGLPISGAIRHLLKREDDASKPTSRKLVALANAEANPDDFTDKLADVFVDAIQANRKLLGLPPLPKDAPKNAPKKKKRPRR